jgi:hypothetical protein
MFGMKKNAKQDRHRSQGKNNDILSFTLTFPTVFSIIQHLTHHQQKHQVSSNKLFQLEKTQEKSAPGFPIHLPIK